MLFTLIGGPYDGAIQLPVPWPEQELPPYVCVGTSEPFSHFVQQGADPVYIYAGPCRRIEHSEGYPAPRQGG